MRCNSMICSMLTGIVLMFGANVMAQHGPDFDAKPLESPKVWKANEIPKEYGDEYRVWQGIPSVAVTSNDRIWATWFTGGKTEDEFNYVFLITSNDKGQTWSKPLFAVDPQDTTRAFDPSLWYDPLGRLWIFWAQANICIRDINGKNVEGPDGDKIRDCRAGVWCMVSENPDAGENSTWSAPRRLSDGIMMNKPIVDSKNRWLYPIAVWRRISRYPVVPEQHIGPNIFVSTDQGKTLSLLGHSKLEAKESGWDEHHVIEKKDGSLWLLLRTLHGMGEAFSKDGGLTWTDAKPSPVIKQTASRFGITRLKSGNLLLVKNGPAGEDVGRNTIMAALSEDDGKTWSKPLVLDDRRDVTYPNVDQTPDGTIYVIYDHGRYREKEILLARFTEKDVKEGKIVSGIGQLKMIVNKATGPHK